MLHEAFPLWRVSCDPILRLPGAPAANHALRVRWGRLARAHIVHDDGLGPSRTCTCTCMCMCAWRRLAQAYIVHDDGLGPSRWSHTLYEVAVAVGV